jgi:UDP-N-acetylglucosamine 2-epimerase (non-hydrolysing)
MVPFVHLEAGMRTNNKYSPFPEEINRRLSSCVADTHLCWTDIEKENLIRENYRGRDVFVTGNTVIDTLLQTASKNFNLASYFGFSSISY